MKKYLAAIYMALCCANLLVATTPAEQLVNATFKIFNNASTATGFLVQDVTAETPAHVILVTAHHVFESAKGDHVLLVCRVKNEQGIWQRHDHKIMIRKDKQQLWYNHPTQDIAVIRCELPPQAIFNALPRTAVLSEAQAQEHTLTVGTPLFYTSYPSRVEANDAGFPILRAGVVSAYPLFPVAQYPSVFHSGPALSGDSGAPIAMYLKDSTPAFGVVGLIITRTQQNDHLQAEGWDITFKRDMHLGSFVHAEHILECLAHLDDQHIDNPTTD